MIKNWMYRVLDYKINKLYSFNKEENHLADNPDKIVELLKGIDLKLSLILGRMIKYNDDDIVIKDEIKKLYQSGADSKTISQILGIPTDHASQEISRFKKTSNKKEKTDGQKNKRK